MDQAEMKALAKKMREKKPSTKPKSVSERSAPEPDGKDRTYSKRAGSHSSPEEDEEGSKVGTDEQPIPDDPGEVTVTQGDRDEHPKDAKQITVSIPEGEHPVVSFGGGRWSPGDVRTVIGSLRRAFRMYQNQLRRANNG